MISRRTWLLGVGGLAAGRLFAAADSPSPNRLKESAAKGPSLLGWACSIPHWTFCPSFGEHRSTGSTTTIILPPRSWRKPIPTWPGRS